MSFFSLPLHLFPPLSPSTRRAFSFQLFQGDWLLKSRDKRETRRVAPENPVGLTLREKRAEDGKGKEAEEALEQMRRALKKVSLNVSLVLLLFRLVDERGRHVADALSCSLLHPHRERTRNDERRAQVPVLVFRLGSSLFYVPPWPLCCFIYSSLYLLYLSLP